MQSPSTFSTPSPKSILNFSRKSIYRGGPYNSWTIIGNGPPQFQDTTTPHLYGRDTQGTRASHADWCSKSSRADHHHQHIGHPTHHALTLQSAHRRQKQIFLMATLLTLLCPPLGYLALSGRLDATISWCTHGELHCLTADQRGTLKQLLLIEMVLYPALIITLAVYYSVHG